MRTKKSVTLKNTKSIKTDHEIYYRAISGSISLVHSEPDGDSVHFIADNSKDFDGLYRSYLMRPNKDGAVQLRFEGIDAPELHYVGPHRQPFGDASRDKMIEITGFVNVQYNGGLTVQSSTPEKISAYILTKGFDPHGRPISYIVTKGIGNVRSGETLSVDDSLLESTINIQLLKSGFAYPLLYTSTPLQHRNFIRNLATQIKKSDNGVWAYDKSMQFRLDDFKSVEPPNGVLVYPKLFRRSVDYLRQTQKGFSGSITDWLNSMGAKENDSLLVDENYEMHLTDIIGQNNDEIVLKYDLMSITFIER